MSGSTRVALGAFVIGGVLLFGIGLFWIGDRRQLFNESIELYTEFSNLSGLAKGAKVRVSGLDAGEVLAIQIPPDPNSRFRVRFRTLKEFQAILRLDSVASIQNDGLVGSKYLQVDSGTAASPPAAPGSTIQHREPVEIGDLIYRVSETVKTANQAVLDIRGGVDGTVKTILNIAEQTSEIINDVGKQMDKFTTTGNTIMSDVSVIVAKTRNGEGTVGRLLNDDKLYKQLQEVTDQGQQVAENLKGISDDLKEFSNDLKSRQLGPKVEQVADNLQTLTKEAIGTIRSFQGPGGSGGMMAEVRQTLTSANETMANFADNSKALKRNFLFRGFFNQRGFFDLDALTVQEYRDGRFMKDRLKVSEWLNTPDLFQSSPDGREQLTPEGRQKLDSAMTNFLKYSKNEPFIIESWAGAGTDPQRVLRSRERAIKVSEYLIDKFKLKPNYVGIMPMNAIEATDNQTRDGIGLVLFAPKPTRK